MEYLDPIQLVSNGTSFVPELVPFIYSPPLYNNFSSTANPLGEEQHVIKRAFESRKFY